MLELDAHALFRAGLGFRTMRLILNEVQKELSAEEQVKPAAEATRVGIRGTLSSVTDACQPLVVPSTADAITRLTEALDGTYTSIRLMGELVRDVEMRLMDDLKRVKTVVIDPSRIAHFADAVGMFGADVQTKYPSVLFEIDEAGRCFALGRYTASAFHLMRVMEIGIYATSRCLGVPDPVKPGDRNWGAILKVVNEAITSKKGTWANQGDAEFFGGVVLSLDRVRNVWRNSTMHVENKYTEDEARDILDAVRAFMKKLASRCDETGQPLA